MPRALRTDEIPELVEDYKNAARKAKDAGFDGVEVHSANNYLLEQFVRDSTNDGAKGYTDYKALDEAFFLTDRMS